MGLLTLRLKAHFIYFLLFILVIVFVAVIIIVSFFCSAVATQHGNDSVEVCQKIARNTIHEQSSLVQGAHLAVCVCEGIQFSLEFMCVLKARRYVAAAAACRYVQLFPASIQGYRKQ